MNGSRVGLGGTIEVGAASGGRSEVRTANDHHSKPRAGGGGEVLETQRGTILAENLPGR